MKVVSNTTGMGGRFQNKEAITMKCHVCGSTMKSMITDLPFKLTEISIVVLKKVPVLTLRPSLFYKLCARNGILNDKSKIVYTLGRQCAPKNMTCEISY